MDGYLVLNELDNVCIAFRVITEGESICGCIAKNDIPRGHKMAISDIAKGEAVLKYGSPIGVALEKITAGEHVHTSNLGYVDDFCSATASSGDFLEPVIPKNTDSFFGYRRSNGKAATRNYIGVISTVVCTNTIVEQIVNYYRFDPAGIEKSAGVDGVVGFQHQSGCAMDDNSLGFDILSRTIDGYLAHPNFSSVLLIGLGCEVNSANNYVSSNAAKLVVQHEGGTTKTVAEAINLIDGFIEKDSKLSRINIPASELIVGLQCGGSDSFSGLTANPSLGKASDLLVYNGGTVILSETPEIFGAEGVLKARATSKDVATNIDGKITWWQEYVRAHGTTLNNNPSKGNLDGGVSTILEKSLGAVTKGGSTPLVEVLDYAQKPSCAGLVFMDSPGFDSVSITGQIASGCHLICFTTGRGSTFGSLPSPVLKICSNDDVSEFMHEDMDVSTEFALTRSDGLDVAGKAIFQEILRVASGGCTKSEAQGYGYSEFNPWQIGAIL